MDKFVGFAIAFAGGWWMATGGDHFVPGLCLVIASLCYQLR